MTTALSKESTSKKHLYLELFVLSIVSLYLELLVIRWLSADFRAFTVFKTFPLVTCFVGLGLGYANTSHSDKAFKWSLWLLAGFVAILQFCVYIGFWHWTFPSIGVYQWELAKYDGSPLYLYLPKFIGVLLVLLGAPFAVMFAIGTRLGELFNATKPLRAYGINLLGAILGSIALSIVSFLGWSPWMMLIPAVCLLAVFVPGRKLWFGVVPALVTLTFAIVNPDPSPVVTTYWSPYQRLDTYPFMLTALDQSKPVPEKLGITIAANGHFYLHSIGLDQKSLSRTDLPPAVLARLHEHARQYDLPYRFLKPKSVLVLGSGAGNDVAGALRNGAENVTAVDIDPYILELGRTTHPEAPYSSPKVNVVCNDARNFLNSSSARFDLIVFAGLDSLTVSGQGASVRLDNYVYTVESLRNALAHLKPNGLVVLSFCKSTDYITRRLFATLTAAAGYQPVVMRDSQSPELPWEIYLTGPASKEIGRTINWANMSPFVPQNIPIVDGERILSDDWPFLYVSPIKVDFPYLIVVGLILSLAFGGAAPMLRREMSGMNMQFLFMGAAFLLLELQSIGRLSLVYGSTWLTSSIVINGVLLMIIVANVIAAKFKTWLSFHIPWIYVALSVTLLASYFLSVEQAISWWGKDVGSLAATFVTLLPMFCAGVLFSTLFSCARNSALALAFNLLGSVIGALLEYASNYVGVSGLVLLALGLYALAFIASRVGSPTEHGAASQQFS